MLSVCGTLSCYRGCSHNLDISLIHLCVPIPQFIFTSILVIYITAFSDNLILPRHEKNKNYLVIFISLEQPVSSEILVKKN